MAGQDTAELVVASYGKIHIAPVGTALPSGVDTALNAAFFDLGLVNEDGVSLTVAPEIEEFMAWQSRQAVRRELTGQEISLAFALEQWNAENVKFAFGGGQISEPTPGNYRYDFPDGDDTLDERALVVDWQDGPSRQYRAVFPRGNVTDDVETQFQRAELAVLPITFKALAPTAAGSPGYLLADDSAFHS